MRELIRDEKIAVRGAEALFRSGRHQKLITHCVEHLKTLPNCFALWNLLAIGYGSTDRPRRARVAFLRALELRPNDGITLANYITSCFHSGDKQSACDGISHFFSGLEASEQQIVLQSVLEAVKTNTISRSDLPKEFLNLIDST